MKRRNFYLIDRENGNAKRRITWKEIIGYFNSHNAPFRYCRANIDLDRFAAEMDEIEYTFVIEQA